MPTQHLSNISFDFGSPINKKVGVAAVLLGLLLFVVMPTPALALLIWCGIVTLLGVAYFLIEQARVRFTMTDTHFQQHLFKGGWVVTWSNISEISLCHYQKDGWCEPMPWIGIRLKDYSPYINSICPRITTQILLEQRALLYLGAKQKGELSKFEDMVLNGDPHISSSGEQFRGLAAMMANRMRYQRQYWGYDLFISESDLDRPIEEFVGLTRRYLAASPSVSADKPRL
ncbi:DUF2982 domain-containing protein [Vibrio tapetis]|uniref:DUF2982 domain-containing protein n=1 Tax=Vibrio tapetis subsp. tapetis TaxID=1671868 RepID=A0A2N8Z8W4_9VIBR|nr:DUF2982 domain-containing protein [Vibrio tapetis]SON48330.1 conserved exported protein of unknown function [Vibrio tapetis subsp. tapetis]